MQNPTLQECCPSVGSLEAFKLIEDVQQGRTKLEDLPCLPFFFGGGGVFSGLSFKRIKSTPDPDTFLKNIAIHLPFLSQYFCILSKVCPLLLFQKVLLGCDMGGGGVAKRMGGGKSTRERDLPKMFWTPPNELLVCSVVRKCTCYTPCSATPFESQLDVRHPWKLTRGKCDRGPFGWGGVPVFMLLWEPLCIYLFGMMCVQSLHGTS